MAALTWQFKLGKQGVEAGTRARSGLLFNLEDKKRKMGPWRAHSVQIQVVIEALWQLTSRGKLQRKRQSRDTPENEGRFLPAQSRFESFPYETLIHLPQMYLFTGFPHSLRAPSEIFTRHLRTQVFVGRFQGGRLRFNPHNEFMISNLLPTQHSPQPGESSHLPHTPPTHTHTHTHTHSLSCVSCQLAPPYPAPPHQHPFSTVHTHTHTHGQLNYPLFICFSIPLHHQPPPPPYLVFLCKCSD
ncbi:unnamed protein product [Leuciscus chuanchicus]